MTSDPLVVYDTAGSGDSGYRLGYGLGYLSSSYGYGFYGLGYRYPSYGYGGYPSAPVYDTGGSAVPGQVTCQFAGLFPGYC